MSCFLTPTKNTPFLEIFERPKDKTDAVVSAQELCPFRVVEGSHSTHEVSRAHEANTDECPETARGLKGLQTLWAIVYIGAPLAYASRTFSETSLAVGMSVLAYS